MSEHPKFPPSRSPRITTWGWILAVISLLLFIMLIKFGHVAFIVLYMILVFVMFMISLPAGQSYYVETREYLAKHPDIKISDLPWPADYEKLSRTQTLHYALRGFWWAAIAGILFPPTAILIGLVELKILKGSVVDKIWDFSGNS